MSRTCSILGLLLVAGCNGAAERPAPVVGADAGTELPCTVDLGELSLSTGGRLRLPDAATTLLSEGWEVTASPGLSIDVRPGGVFVYAGYAPADDAHLRLHRSGCDDVAVPVEARPLAWERIAEWDPAVAGPPGREYGAWWLDGEEGLVVFGGFHYYPRQFTPASDMWRFDFAAGAWSEVPSEGAPLAPGGRAARGAEPGTALVHGGSAIRDDGSLDTPPLLFEVDTRGETAVWRPAPHAERAPGSYTGAFVHDPRRDRWLSLCGVDARLMGVHCAVHEYRPGTGWQRVIVDGDVPPGRFGFHYAYDEETDRVIVVGGQAGPDNLDMVGDTWALELGEEPPRWEKLFDETPELRRRNGAFVLDPIGRRLILFGGTADGATSVGGLSILRIDREMERWDHVEIPESVPARTSGLAVYDAPRARALFGFGNGAAVYTDLYALSL